MGIFGGGSIFSQSHPVTLESNCPDLVSHLLDQGFGSFKLCDHHLWKVALTCILLLDLNLSTFQWKRVGKGILFFFLSGGGGCLCKYCQSLVTWPNLPAREAESKWKTVSITKWKNERKVYQDIYAQECYTRADGNSPLDRCTQFLIKTSFLRDPTMLLFGTS